MSVPLRGLCWIRTNDPYSVKVVL